MGKDDTENTGNGNELSVKTIVPEHTPESAYEYEVNFTGKYQGCCCCD